MDVRPPSPATGREKGRSLDEHVRVGGPMQPREVLLGLLSLAQRLTTLHAGGLIHGRLAPTAVALGPFGAWTIAAASRESHWSTEDPDSGDPYVAPEVDEGGTATPASDIYALGALAWFALTSQAPPELAWRPCLRDVLPAGHGELADVVTSCLALTPSARPTAGELVDLLGSVCRSEVRVIPRRRGMTYPSRRAWRQAGERRASRRAARRAVRARRMVLGASGLVVFGLAAVSWLGADRGSAAALPSVRPGRPPITAPSPSARPTPKPVPRRTHTRVDLPGRADVEAVLSCRAQAWNTGRPTGLRACLAENSQALADDTAKLEAAAVRGVAYRRLRFVVQHIERIVLEHGDPMARVTVHRTPHVVVGPHRAERVDGATETVRLVFAGGPGRWKLAAWNVVDGHLSATSRSKN